MRNPHFRVSDSSDWGTDPYSKVDAAHEFLDACTRLWKVMVIHPRSRVLAARRAAKEPGCVKVSLGCGRSVPEGWIGLDDKYRGSSIYQWDLRRGLPFHDQSVDAILAEHVIEHLSLDDYILLLRECHRCLRDGGILRIVSPDARIIAALILGQEGDREEQQIEFDKKLHQWAEYPPLGNRVANRLAYQWGQHQSLLEPRSLKVILRHTGFDDIVSLSPADSRYFKDVPGTHIQRFPDSIHESFAVEALRRQGRPDS